MNNGNIDLEVAPSAPPEEPGQGGKREKEDSSSDGESPILVSPCHIGPGNSEGQEKL